MKVIPFETNRYDHTKKIELIKKYAHYDKFWFDLDDNRKYIHQDYLDFVATIYPKAYYRLNGHQNVKSHLLYFHIFSPILNLALLDLGFSFTSSNVGVNGFLFILLKELLPRSGPSESPDFKACISIFRSLPIYSKALFIFLICLFQMESVVFHNKRTDY